ncbi:nucleotidyltransferase family protein [Thalassotalea ganghwensis]
MNHRLAIVILAAGCSSRLGQNKLMVEIEGESMIRRQCQLVSSFQYPVYCVTGFQSESVAKELSSLPITIIENRQWSQGLASSIKAASVNVTASPNGSIEQLIYVLADQWLLDKSCLKGFLAFSLANPNHIVVASQLDIDPQISKSQLSTIGPPVSFPKSLFPTLNQLSSGSGAKRVISDNLSLALPYFLPEAFTDLDTQQQLALMRVKFPH